MAKIFFVEDNRTEAIVMRLAFSGIEGIDVSYFNTGQDLLSHMKEQPDIAIVDLVLPDIDGVDLIKTIRKTNPSTYIIVVSAQEEVSTISKVQNEGVFNYVVKSESCLKYLKKVIEDLLSLIAYQKEKNEKH